MSCFFFLVIFVVLLAIDSSNVALGARLGTLSGYNACNYAILQFHLSARQSLRVRSAHLCPGAHARYPISPESGLSSSLYVPHFPRRKGKVLTANDGGHADQCGTLGDKRQYPLYTYWVSLYVFDRTLVLGICECYCD